MRLFWTLVRLHARNAAPWLFGVGLVATAGRCLFLAAAWLHRERHMKWGDAIGMTVVASFSCFMIFGILVINGVFDGIRPYFRRTYSEAAEQVRADDSEQASLLRGSGNR